MPTDKMLTIHQSFEEMESARYRYAASIDPVQGLRETVDLIVRVYGTSREELNSRPRPCRVTITQYP